MVDERWKLGFECWTLALMILGLKIDDFLKPNLRGFLKVFEENEL
jgi:hypothetical protein